MKTNKRMHIDNVMGGVIGNQAEIGKKKKIA